MGKMMSSSNKCYLTVAGFCPSQSNLPFLLRATSSSPGACQSYSSPRLISSAAYSTCTMGETNGATNGASNGATQVCSLIHFSATYELKHDILKSRRVAKTFVKNWVDIFWCTCSLCSAKIFSLHISHAQYLLEKLLEKGVNCWDVKIVSLVFTINDVKLIFMKSTNASC